MFTVMIFLLPRLALKFEHFRLTKNMSYKERLALIIKNEWDYERNGDLNPQKIDPNQKVYWRCNNNCICGKEKCLYYWTATIKDRLVDSKNCCIICAGRAYACRHTGIVSTRPDIVEEYDDFKNDIGIYALSISSNRKVFWKCNECEHGCHEWEAKVLERAKGQNCPYCSGRRICPHKNLMADCPELVPLWNNEKAMSEYTMYSNCIVGWKCDRHECGCIHTWEAQISNVVKKRNTINKGCPLCAKKVCCVHTCILETHPHIAATFDYDGNEDVDITRISKGSTQKLSWICSNGHTYFSSVRNRVGGKGCPKCINKTEGIVAEELIKLYDIHSQFKATWCKNIRHLLYDIMLEDQYVIIEIDGDQHFKPIRNWTDHIKTLYVDTYKCIKALLNGYSVIRIYQPYIFKHKHDTSMWLPKILDAINMCGESDEAKTYYIGYDMSGLYDKHEKDLDGFLKSKTIKELSALTFDDVVTNRLTDESKKVSTDDDSLE